MRDSNLILPNKDSQMVYSYGQGVKEYATLKSSFLNKIL